MKLETAVSKSSLFLGLSLRKNNFFLSNRNFSNLIKTFSTFLTVRQIGDSDTSQSLAI